MSIYAKAKIRLSHNLLNKIKRNVFNRTFFFYVRGGKYLEKSNYIHWGTGNADTIYAEYHYRNRNPEYQNLKRLR